VVSVMELIEGLSEKEDRRVVKKRYQAASALLIRCVRRKDNQGGI